jgi:hypothetical protein
LVYDTCKNSILIRSCLWLRTDKTKGKKKKETRNKPDDIIYIRQQQTTKSVQEAEKEQKDKKGNKKNRNKNFGAGGSYLRQIKIGSVIRV